jgi:hypothetical protein
MRPQREATPKSAPKRKPAGDGFGGTPAGYQLAQIISRELSDRIEGDRLSSSGQAPDCSSK